MGKPVRILDLARQMIQLSGKVPDVDVMIEFTGLKRGEKLEEVLSDDGEDARPCVEGIVELLCRDGSGEIALADILALADRARPTRESVLRMVDRIRS